MTNCEVLIIGGGVLGCSAFYHLQSAGLSTCLIEANTVASGITSYSGGVVRSFHLDRQSFERASEGLHYFRDFYKHVGVDVTFRTNGFLYFPNHDKEEDYKTLVSRWNEISSRNNFQWLNREALLSRFHFLNADQVVGAIWEANAGYINPVEVSQAWINAGISKGGRVFQGTNAIEPVIKHNRLQAVETNLGIINCSQVLIAAGASSPDLVQRFGYESNCYTKTIQVDCRATNVAPSVPCFIDEQFNLHGRGGDYGVLIGHPMDSGTHEVPERHHSLLTEQVAKNRFNWLEFSELNGSFCALDCFSDRELGYMEFIDEAQQIFLLSGFNGSAFKFSPFIGNYLVPFILNNFGEK